MTLWRFICLYGEKRFASVAKNESTNFIRDVGIHCFLWYNYLSERKECEVMKEQFIRTAMLLGEDAVERLNHCRVAVFGVGGVGGYVCEALARSGVGKLDLIDMDRVNLSNINRQIIALTSTVGRYKTEVMKERILDINPEAEVAVHNCFYLPETKQEFDFSEYDYVVDAVDTVTAKLSLVMECKEHNVPVISSMGAGNKLEPTGFMVADIYDTSVCPLAKVMRKELKARGVKSLKVVYSKEKALSPIDISGDSERLEEHCSENRESGNGEESGADFGIKKRATPGSIAFVPSVVGLIIASEVVKDLCGKLSVCETHQSGS